MSDFNEFTLADREACDAIARAFFDERMNESAKAWAELARKIECVLVGEYARFTKADLAPIGALYRAIQTNPPPCDRILAHVGDLKRLNLLVYMATKDRLPQLRVPHAR